MSEFCVTPYICIYNLNFRKTCYIYEQYIPAHQSIIMHRIEHLLLFKMGGSGGGGGGVQGGGGHSVG